MPIEGAHDLATPDGQDDYGNDLHALMRAGQFDEASALLARDIADLSTELWEICDAARADALTLHGWSALSAALVDPEWAQITAVGIDISGHGINPTGDPNLEISFYSDDSFPFSSAGRDAILAENEGYGTPWQGSFDAIDVVDLRIEGMADLHGVIVDEQGRTERPEPGSDAAVALFLAIWWRTAQFHRLIHDLHAREGLSREVPIVVGSHDCGPFMETVIAVEVTEPSEAPTWQAPSDPMNVEVGIAMVDVEENAEDDAAPAGAPEIEMIDHVSTPEAPDEAPTPDPWSVPGLDEMTQADHEAVQDDALAEPPVASDEEGGDFSARALRRKLAMEPGEPPVEHKPSLLGRLFSKR